MTVLFADTFYYLALLNPSDAAHGRAVAFSRQLRGKQLTTTSVLTEVGDAMAGPEMQRSRSANEDLRRTSLESRGDRDAVSGRRLH